MTKDRIHNVSALDRRGTALPMVLGVVAVFVLCALPFAIWQLTSNSDEPRYTLAAARMMATGEYIIPYAAWGEIRLLKPPLTYYYAVAGMGLFGQSVFSVKIIWVISATMVLALTWALAQIIGANRRAAAMASAALAANLLFFQSALTHNPDIPMTLGLTIALVGFSRVCADAPPARWAIYAGWLGLAWAFLAKGLLAVALASVVIVVRLILHRARRRGGMPWPTGHEWLAVALATVAGGWWHAIVALRAPDALMAQFLGDQVAEKVALSLGDYLTGLVFFATAAVIGFVPVLLALLVGRLHAIAPDGQRDHITAGADLGPVILLVAWICACVAIFAFSNFRVGRYMLPAMPAAAALLALGFNGMDGAQIARRCGRAVRIMLPLSAVVAVLSGMILYMARADAALAVWAIFATLLIAGLWWLAGRLGPVGAVGLLVGALPGAVLLFLPGYMILGSPSAADLALRAIRNDAITPSQVYVLRRWHLVERVGLRQPPLQDYLFSDRLDPALLARAQIVITTHPQEADALIAAGWQVQMDHGAPEKFSARAFLDAVIARDATTFRTRFGEPLLIARPPPGPGTLPP